MCNECKRQATGSTLAECLEGFVCGQDGGTPDDGCKAALVADGNRIFELNQVIDDDYKGKTNLSGKVEPKKPSTPEVAKKEKVEEKKKFKFTSKKD